MQHCVVGFEFTGDPLLEGAFLPFCEGLTVLYGLNGAGKTRLAEGMRAALTGVKSHIDVSMIVRLQVPTELDLKHDRSQDEQPTPGAGLLVAIAERFAVPADFEFSMENRQFITVSKANEVTDRFIRAQFDARNERAELRDEVAADRLFLMHPAGTSADPSWDVWPVADPTGPEVRESLERLNRAGDEIEALEYSDEGMDVFQEAVWNTPLRGNKADHLLTRERRRFYTTTFIPYSGDASSFEPFHAFPIQGALDLGIDVLLATGDPNADTIDYLGEIVIRAASIARTLEDKSAPGESVRDALSGGWDLESARRLIEHKLRSRSGGDDSSHDVDEIAVLTRLVDRLAGEVSLELEVRAKAAIEQMMIDAPTPVLQLTPAITRFSNPAAQWLFRRGEGGQLVNFENLSRAERIWAGAAVDDALYWHRREHTSRPGDELRPVVTILDEPETALHRSAEAHTARALVDRARDPRRIIVAATHSPELLDAREARIIEVKRGGGKNGASVVRELNLADKAALGELGLSPSDLLRWPRIFLLVEGAHDEALLDAFFGDRLRAARVQILPLRGATKLPGTIDSRVLFDFTGAHLVALVDNQDLQQLGAAWAQALENRASGTLEAATAGLADAVLGDGDEARFLREWLTAALRTGVESRVTPYSLEAKDIIEYVPVGSLIATHASWDILRVEHAGALAARNGSPRDFKKWLEATYKVVINPDLLREAARGVDRAPQELERLMKTLEAIAHQR